MPAKPCTRNRVCVISAFEEAGFRKTGQLPPCRLHQHFSIAAVERLAAESPPAARFLSEHVAAWADHRVLRRRESGGLLVVQLVRA